jgi:hypothetical protein
LQHFTLSYCILSPTGSATFAESRSVGVQVWKIREYF